MPERNGRSEIRVAWLAFAQSTGSLLVPSPNQRDGKIKSGTFTNENYLKDLAAPNEPNVRERMWNPEVRIRGFIASVWTPYASGLMASTATAVLTHLI